MDKLIKDWTPTSDPHLSSREIEQLFRQLLDELGFCIECRQTEEWAGPRSFVETEYRLAKRK